MESGELDEGAVQPKRARELIARDGAQPLDLRSEEEFAAGHIAGAVRASANEIDAALESLDADRAVLVVSVDGEATDEVAATLRDRGFEAAPIEGGMNGWVDDKLPMLPRETEEFHGPG